MKFSGICLLAIVAFATAKIEDLEFEEDGVKFHEKIKIDEKNGIVIVDVPDHGNVQGAKYLSDFNVRLRVQKTDVEKRCYVQAMSSDELSPAAVKLGLQKYQNKFPTRRYEVRKVNQIPVAIMEPHELSKAINDFCGDYDVLRVVEADKPTMEKIALEEAKALKRQLKNPTKRAVTKTVTEFTACTAGSQFLIATCAQDELVIKCKWIGFNKCVYYIGCTLGNTGWSCPAQHRYDRVNCCDYGCKTK